MQDNKSAIILPKNWPFSTGKGSKHINVRYYYVVDKIKNKEVKMIYCPTDEHTGDYNSKPLQGKLCFDHRNTIMGICEQDFGYYKQLYIKALM